MPRFEFFHDLVGQGLGLHKSVLSLLIKLGARQPEMSAYPGSKLQTLRVLTTQDHRTTLCLYYYALT